MTKPTKKEVEKVLEWLKESNFKNIQNIDITGHFLTLNTVNSYTIDDNTNDFVETLENNGFEFETETDTNVDIIAENKRMKAALEDIKNWNDDLDIEYDDQGQRAKIGLGLID